MAVKKLRNIILGTALALGACSSYQLPDESVTRLKNMPKAKVNIYDSMTHDEARKKISNLDDLMGYFKNHLNFEIRDQSEVGAIVNSSKKTHESKKGQCIDYAIAGAHKLEDDGYNLYLLKLNRSPGFSQLFKDLEPGHAVCIYEKDGKYGFFDNSGYIKPIFNSMDELIKKTCSKKFDLYAVYSFDKAYKGKDWRNSDKNIARHYGNHIKEGFISDIDVE